MGCFSDSPWQGLSGTFLSSGTGHLELNTPLDRRTGEEREGEEISKENHFEQISKENHFEQISKENHFEKISKENHANTF